MTRGIKKQKSERGEKKKMESATRLQCIQMTEVLSYIQFGSKCIASLLESLYISKHVNKYCR